MKIYLVGGAVRDSLLHLSGSDRDWVVVGATIEQMLAKGFKPVGKDFPVFLHPDSAEEYALARTERKSGKGYKGFTVYAAADVSLEDDLQRRDLTINAMARDDDGHLIDPWGGQRDIALKLLRHVSAAFSEDPLRVLRVARFAARFAPLGFVVADDTQQLMRDMVAAGELEHLFAERVWREFDTALGEAQARVFIEVLRACGALRVLLPELDRLFGVPQPATWHPEIDTGLHTLMVLEQACRLSPDKTVRFAALMHDLGKGTTAPQEWPRHIGHESRGAELIDTVCRRLRVPTAYSELAVLASRYHTHCHQALTLRANTLLALFESLDAFRRADRLEKFLLVCEADARGRLGLAQQPYPQAEYLRQAFNTVAEISVPDLLREHPLAAGPDAGEKIKRRLQAKRLQLLREFVQHQRRPG
jgi:tRNA nucleotidyltransferase (CCA-adding enzyme)